MSTLGNQREGKRTMRKANTHSRRRPILALAGFAATVLLAGCATPPAPTWEGLEYRATPGVDEAYVRPGTDLKAYRSVYVEPVRIVFDKDWDPNRTRRDLAQVISPEDIEKLKAEMSADFREVFASELASGGYQVVEQAGPGALRLAPSLNDVYINALDPALPGHSNYLTRDAGEMTMVLEARDASTGQLLVRVADKRKGVETNFMQITNSVSNKTEFRRQVRDWARACVQALRG